MSLKEFEKKGWLRHHTTSRQEIQDLLSIVTRDLQDAEAPQLSADWRFGIAYNGALKLCTILLYTQGYRSDSGSHHMRTITTLSVANELIKFTWVFLEDVTRWLRSSHPALM